MFQGVSEQQLPICFGDTTVTVSSVRFLRSVQTGYQAYQNDQSACTFNEHELYELFVHRLLAYPDTTSENTGWIIGWVKAMLEAAASPSPALQMTDSSLSLPPKKPVPYGDNFLPVIPSDTPLHTLDHPVCFDATCPCHEDWSMIAEVAQYVTDGLMTPGEATEYVKGKSI